MPKTYAALTGSPIKAANAQEHCRRLHAERTQAWAALFCVPHCRGNDGCAGSVELRNGPLEISLWGPVASCRCNSGREGSGSAGGWREVLKDFISKMQSAVHKRRRRCSSVSSAQ